MFETSVVIAVQHLLNPFTTALARVFSSLGSLTIYLIVVPFLYWCISRRKAHQIGFILLISIWLNVFLKDMVAYARPDSADGVKVLFRTTSNGFPSGFTQNAVTFWGSLALWVRSTWFRIVCAAVVVLIAISRILLGADFLGDVVWGLVIGAAVLAAFTTTFHRQWGHRRQRATRITWAVTATVVLMLLDPSPTAYAALGLLLGWIVTDSFALEAVEWDEHAPIPTQAVRLLVGYLGLAVLILIVTRFVPEGLPEFLAFALVSGWITLGAPFVLGILGFSGGDKRPAATTNHSRDVSPRALRNLTTVGTIVIVAVVVLSVAALPGVPATHEAVPALASADSIVSDRNPLKDASDGLTIAHQTPDGRPFAVIGHKGSAATAPEETLPSFTEAVKLHVDFLDLDLRMTKDHHFVLLHDDTVDATTNGHGAIENMTLAQVKRLDAGYWYTNDGGKTYPYRGKGIHLMTLDEFLQTFPQQQINIEMKNHARVAGQELAQVIAANHAQGRVVVGSFWDPPLDAFRAQMPQVRSMITQSEVLHAFIMAHLGLEAFWHTQGTFGEIPETRGPLRLVTPGFVDFLHEQGVTVIVWTVDDEASMKRLMHMGIDGIISDNPGRLLKVTKHS